MISPEDTYPGRTIPASASYPEGSIKNETIPNSSDDGTPLDELWGNDFEGLKQAIARSASIVPTAPGDIPDTAIASQILQGIIELAQGRASNYDDSGIADAYVLDVQANQQAPSKLFDGQEFEFIAGNTSTGASTVNPVGTGIKNIISTSIAGTIIAGHRYRLRYRLSTTDFEIINIGQVIQSVRTDDSAVATGTTQFPLDDTIPQNTEGDEYITVSITPRSANNKLIIKCRLDLNSTTVNTILQAALFQDAVANALVAARGSREGASGRSTQVWIDYEMVAGTTAAITFKVRAGSIAAGTTTFNGDAGARLFGGVMNSFIQVTEVSQ